MIDANYVRAFFQENHAKIVKFLERKFFPLYGNLLEEQVQNAIALAFENVLSCATRGKIADPNALDLYVRRSLFWAIRHTHAGRSIHDKSRKEDAVFGDLWEKGSRVEDSDAILRGFESRDTNPADAAAFRIDLESFLSGFEMRQRTIFDDLMSGSTTGEMAERYNLSPGRISQFRRMFFEMIQEFFAE